MHFFFHHLNDFSGSPRIIDSKIKAYNLLGADVFIVTNDDAGFIDTAKMKHCFLPYSKSSSRIVKLLRLTLWWISASWFILVNVKKDDIVHANTLINAPILLAAKLKQAVTVIHVMEFAISPKILKKTLRLFASNFADTTVYLSEFLRDIEPIKSSNSSLITYPSIDISVSDAGAIHHKSKDRNSISSKTVCMVCSLIWFKGYKRFVELARNLPNYKFMLVINGSPVNFYKEFSDGFLPDNLEIKFNQSAIQDVLGDVGVVVSLTDREGWVETFGLTLAEAMSFGIPVIAPNIGAQTEYIVHGYNGFLVNEGEIETIGSILKSIFESENHYQSLSDEAYKTALDYGVDRLKISVIKELDLIASQKKVDLSL
jgi:L-malate glycosyltransferase